MSGAHPQWRGDQTVLFDAATIPAGVIDAPGEQPRFGSVTLAPRASGQSLVRVVAAALNPLDLLIASGSFHSARHELPYVPGSECVGVVVDSERWDAGTIVYAECHASPTTPGAMAAHAIVRDEDILPVPVDLDPVLAAAVGNSGTAAYLALVETAGFNPGETVLVLGATGAVGQLAVQIAHLRGAGRVIGVGRDRSVLEALLPLGADAVVELSRSESTTENTAELASRMRDVAGPVDVILDTLYGGPLEAALHACAPHARVVNVGSSAGETARIPAGLLRGRQITLSGFAGVHVPLAQKSAALTWLWSAMRRGELQVDVRTYPLEELPLAWRAQAASSHAKNVILPGEGAAVSTPA